MQKYPQANPERGKAEQVGNGQQWSVWSRWQGRPWCGVTAANHWSPGRTCEIPHSVLTSSNPPPAGNQPKPDQGMTDGGHWCRQNQQDRRSSIKSKALSCRLLCFYTYQTWVIEIGYNINVTTSFHDPSLCLELLKYTTDYAS